MQISPLSTHIHPEAKPAEVLVRNFTGAGFRALTLLTKRKGVQPYDGEGKRLIETRDWYPVFALSSEVEMLPGGLRELRSSLS